MQSPPPLTTERVVWASPSKAEGTEEETLLESKEWKTLLEELKQETSRDIQCLRVESDERLEHVIEDFREKEHAMKAALVGWNVPVENARETVVSPTHTILPSFLPSFLPSSIHSFIHLFITPCVRSFTPFRTRSHR